MSKCSSSKAELPVFKSQPTAYLLCHSVHFSCSVVSDPLGPHEVQHTGLPVHHQLPELESVMPSNHLIFCRPLLLPSIFLTIRIFSSESALCIRWPKYWSFSFSISSSGWISFRKFPGLISLLSKGLSRAFSNTTVKKHQFFCTQPSLLSILTCKVGIRVLTE